jgi:hypothetical protein
MRKYWAMAAFVFLAGCGIWSPVIRSDVIDYGDVVETTSDKFLLVNILEARDNAPLHFMEFPKVSGSLTATASLQSAIPFAPVVVGSGGNGVIDPTLTPNIGVTASPTFEVDNVDTTDFTNGISSPVDPKFVKYWIDRGLDKRLILHMFFSAATITEKLDVPPSCKPGKDKRLRDASACAVDMEAETIEELGSCQRVSQGKSADTEQCGIDLSLVGQDEVPHCAPDQIAKTVDACVAAGINILTQCRMDADEKPNRKTCTSDLFNIRLPGPCRGLAKTSEQCVAELTNKARGLTVTIFDNPRDAADKLADCVISCHSITEFELYVKLLDAIQNRFAANIYTEKSLLSENVKIDNSDVPNYDPSQYELEGVPSGPSKRETLPCTRRTKNAREANCYPGYGIFNIYSVSSAQKVAFCFGGESAEASSKSRADACTHKTIVDRPSNDPPAMSPDTVLDDLISANTGPNVSCEPEVFEGGGDSTNPSEFCRIFRDYLIAYQADGDCRKHQSSIDGCNIVRAHLAKRFSLGLTTRSAAEMVRFVGDVLYYQERLANAEGKLNVKCDPHHNLPLTVGWPSDPHPPKCSPSVSTTSEEPGEDLSWSANPSAWNAASGGFLFRIAYNGADTRFTVVYKGSTYGLANSAPDDHSLEVLSILNQVINLNKKASDLRITPIIQVVP